VRWLRSDSGRNPLAGIIGAGLFLAALAGLFLVVWAYSRGDRKFRERFLAKQSGPNAGFKKPDDPDFSNLP
jgi:hypothetical protein